MKRYSFTTVIVAMLITVISCTSNTQKDAETSTVDKQKTTNGSPAIAKDMENILGEWNLDRILRDDNGNHKIDGDEEKTAIINPGGYMRLNADGTCKFESVMDGTYEIITEADGRKRLAIKDLAGTKYPMSQFIVSVTDKELVINNIAGGSGFDVYKRP